MQYVVRFRLSDASPHDHPLCNPPLKPKPSDRNGKLATDQTAHPDTNPIASGAASFKSLYLQRPPKIMHPRTIVQRALQIQP